MLVSGLPTEFLRACGQKGKAQLSLISIREAEPLSTQHNPPNWDNNPSSWSQRLPIVVLSIIGALVSGYLTLYQLDVISTVWEPFFGDGSETILNSSVSNILPIPDAALGMLGYLADAVTGVIGRKERWRTMPWIVVLFGLAVGPFGIASIVLVILQPVMFDAWCTLCLASAVVSLLMIGPAMDEVLASLQYLKRQKRQGRSLWDAFWHGSDEPETSATAGGR